MFGKAASATLAILLVSCASKPVTQPTLKNDMKNAENVKNAGKTTTPSQVLKFALTTGSLEANLRRLLGEYGKYQHIYWNVSKRHQVVAAASVTADTLYQLVDKIIAPYKQPSQIRATFYRANGVVTFDYSRSMGNENSHE